MTYGDLNSCQEMRREGVRAYTCGRPIKTGHRCDECQAEHEGAPAVVALLRRELAEAEDRNKQWERVADEYAVRANEAEAALAEALEWSDDDQPIPEDEAINAAHPVCSGAHATYQEAMRMVGAKRSKGALVDLVTWLLVRAETAEANSTGHAPGKAP